MGVKGQVAWNKGKTGCYSEETKNKISQSLMGNIPWNKGIPMRDETRKKLSEANRGRTAWNKGKHIPGNPHTEEAKEKMRIAHTGKKMSEEAKKKMSEAKKGKTPWNKGKKGMCRRGVPQTEETKEKIRLANMGKRHSEETKMKMSISHTGRKHTEDSIAKIKRTKRIRPFRWSEENKKRIGQQCRERSVITKHKRSASMKLVWKNPEFAKKVGIARGMRPNKPESYIMGILNSLYPDEWKYTGDFSFIIGGKNPDFTNINGQKKLIELYGDYWHQGQNPQDRIDLFRRFGWETLVIWEHELKDVDDVKLKINEFATRDVCPKQTVVVEMEVRL